LNFVNPLSLLDKGYTIIKKENKLISSITELEINDLIKINFKDGMITSEVKNKEEKTYERNEL
jgi:exodeoxyribonuclease VII large subunit